MSFCHSIAVCRLSTNLVAFQITRAATRPKKENQMKSEKKFLITGPTGATGGETVEQLLEKGHSVRALAHREDERSERLSKLGAEVVFGDLLDMESVRSALR